MIDPVKQMERRRHKREGRRRAREYVRGYLEHHPCVQCGFSDHRALQFHHREPEHKEATISRLISSAASIETIAAEMRKCIVLCANCHLIHHAEERNGHHD